MPLYQTVPFNKDSPPASPPTGSHWNRFITCLNPRVYKHGLEKTTSSVGLLRYTPVLCERLFKRHSVSGWIPYKKKNNQIGVLRYAH